MSTRTKVPLKRTQRDYSLSFKLSVVDAVEKGELSQREAKERYGIRGKSKILVWLRKHGRLDWSIRRKRSYTQTTMSKHWLRKYPNLIKTIDVRVPEQV